jgi:hypothetical protein
MLKTLKLNNKKQKKSPFNEEKSFVGLTPSLKIRLLFEFAVAQIR